MEPDYKKEAWEWIRSYIEGAIEYLGSIERMSSADGALWALKQTLGHFDRLIPREVEKNGN
jgi:hypothetical protein